ncbi:MAG: hypothetical protein ACRERU_19025 [Methylococcales bacterium]
MRVQIYFLGNPQPYSAHNLATQAPAWFKANSLRASLISPVLEILSAMEDTSLVVLGDGPIYDLEDWRDSPFRDRLRLVHFGIPLQPTGAGLPELESPTVQILLHSLFDPVTTIRLRESGFFPLDWGGSAYRLIEDQGHFILRGERPSTATLTVRCLLCRDENLHVERRHATGRVSRLEMRPLPAVGRPADGRLTSVEVAILDLACRKLDFICPHCGAAHAWNTLRCRPHRAIIDQPVFPSLSNQRGFVKIYRDAEGAEYWLEGKALSIGDGLVALREGGRARVLRFDPLSARWLPATGEFSAYQPLGAGCYGLLL